MVLVDTSVWINHFRNSESQLIELLKNNQVACHPLIVGEIACGSLHNRHKTIALLQALPMLNNADNVLEFIEENSIMSKGVGIVDVSLLASARLNQTTLWTVDKRLHAIAVDLNLAF